MKRRQLFYILLSLMPLLVIGESFNFQKNLQEWGSWGSGIGLWDKENGHKAKGSIFLSTDWGEEQTTHYNFSGIASGKYLVTAYVYGENIQKGEYDTSFWHFYNSGSGVESVFTDMRGSFEWKKISYTLNVSKGELDLWFRLKSPGKVWIDDIKLVKTKESKKLTFEKSTVETKIIKLEPSQRGKKEKAKDYLLFGFEKNKRSSESGHPFDIVQNDGSLVGEFESNEYYNFDVTNLSKSDWRDFSRISLDVFNPSSKEVPFLLALSDSKTQGYWGQLNHKTHLSPGLNHLNFSLGQYVGERGSHRYKRTLDLSDITKVFIIVDQLNKFKITKKFYIDNIRLQHTPFPAKPTHFFAFDFTSHKAGEINGISQISTQSLYDKKSKHGFIEPKFWRVLDSKFTDELSRFSIGLLKGKFRVDLPNGKYKYSLNWDALGYWDALFGKIELY